MAISTLVQAGKRYFEDTNAAREGRQFDEAFFPELDESPATTIQLDQYLGQGFAMSVTRQGEKAHVVAYVPGVGNEWTPLTSKRKTPIDEKLADSAVVGLEPKAPQSQHMMRVVQQILGGPKGFMAAMKMMRIKMAVDVLRSGEMKYYDEDGTATEIDFERDSSLTLTYDFATESNSFDGALLAAYNAGMAFGLPQGGLAVLLGDSWLTEYNTDAAVLAKRRNTVSANYVTDAMKPPMFRGVEGLYVVGQYQPDGLAFPVWILSYKPAWQYVGYSGAAAASFIPAAEMIMLNIDSPAYRFNRGIQVVGSSGNIERAVGDMVIDSFRDDDPPADWLRANVRTFYARGNIDHTSVTTGSNFGS